MRMFWSMLFALLLWGIGAMSPPGGDGKDLTGYDNPLDYVTVEKTAMPSMETVDLQYTAKSLETLADLSEHTPAFTEEGAGRYCASCITTCRHDKNAIAVTGFL